MQDHPGAPGTARQESTRTTVSTYDGGTATQPRAPGHERPHAALRAARHGRLSAASTAPGADIPPATTAGAPGQYCQSAALLAPGHERPRAALRATRHDRPRAATRAPGADVPPATAAGAPGQYRLRAALLAPGHERPRAALRATRHDRPRAATRAPGADVPLVTVAGAPGQHRPSAVAIATVASPAGSHRLRQVILPRTPATPNTLTYPHAHQDTIHTRTMDRRVTKHAQSRESANPRPPVATGGPQGGQIMPPASSLRHKPQSTNWSVAGRRLAPSPGACSGGGPGRGRLPDSTTHQVHPATQVPPRPRSCSTAGTGFPLHHAPRAPPMPVHRKPTRVNDGSRAPQGTGTMKSCPRLTTEN